MNAAVLKRVQKPWLRTPFFLHPLLTEHKPHARQIVWRFGAMSAAAIFGAVMSCIFVAAFWFNDHGPIPPQDSSEQKDKTQQTDEKIKG